MSKQTITVPPTACQAIEDAIKAKGLTAPRITPSDVQANIASEHYFTAAEAARLGGTEPHPLDLLTFCVLVLKNGFTVTGESACASPENFDAEIGRRIARENAIQKIWPLMGYELRSHLHERAQYLAQPRCGKGQTDNNDAPQDCPHAAPFRYCPECVADPCPVSLGNAGVGVSGE